MNVNYSLDKHAYPPRRAYTDDAGTDLALNHPAIIPAGQHRVCHTGVHVAIPKGHVGMVFVRSSTGIKRNLVLSNGTGIIDAGYTGEIMLSLHNTGRHMQTIPEGHYIAQLVILPTPEVRLNHVEALDNIERAAQKRYNTIQNIEAVGDFFLSVWPQHLDYSLPFNYAKIVYNYIAKGISQDEIEHLVQVALNSPATAGRKFQYFCGCCRNVIREIEESARELEGGDDEGFCSD